jgi:mono/diheme cytochrome c family protein
VKIPVSYIQQRAKAGLALPGLALLLVASCLLAACASMAEREARLPLPTAPDSATDARYRQGRSLYVRKCALCHDLFEPTEFSAHEWPAYVKRYGPRAGLSAVQRTDVTAYLQAASKH